jgi:hypothetical protein
MIVLRACWLASSGPAIASGGLLTTDGAARQSCQCSLYAGSTDSQYYPFLPKMHPVDFQFVIFNGSQWNLCL